MSCNTILGSSCGYPVPTNAAYAGYPELPLGFVYPQASLDRTCTSLLAGCSTPRARAGVWAYEAGRLYLMPWLQSTERVLVQWNGIRRTWLDTDLCIDFADYEAAVKNFVMWKHYTAFERDPQQCDIFEAEYRKDLAKLIHDCREETRDHTCEPRLAQQSLATLQGQSTQFISGVATPQQLTLTNVQSDSITVSWADVSNCTVRFIVERSLDGLTWNQISDLAQCITILIDTDIVPETPYYYRVIAYDPDTGDQSVPTPPVSTTTPAAPTSTTTTTTPPPDPSKLINVAFLFSGATSKTGAAAIGQPGDFWNSFTAAIEPGALALNTADNVASAVSIQSVGTQGGSFGNNGNSDPMLASYFEKSTTPFNKFFSIAGLISGAYSLYLYGWGSQAGEYPCNSCKLAAGHWTVYAGGVIVGTGKIGTNDDPPFVQSVYPGPPPDFCPTLGNYVVIPDIPVQAGQTLDIECFFEYNCSPPVVSYGKICGIQIIQL